MSSYDGEYEVKTDQILPKTIKYHLTQHHMTRKLRCYRDVTIRFTNFK